jgi:hypothetical protein
MEQCLACSGFLTALKMLAHRARYDGTKAPWMPSRPGLVRFPTMRTSGKELRRIASVEGDHIVQISLNVKLKLKKARQDIRGLPPVFWH